MPDNDLDVDFDSSLVEPGHFGNSIDQIIIERNFVEPEDLAKVQLLVTTIDKWDNPRETEYNDEGVCIYDASYWWDRVCNSKILEENYLELYNLVDKYNMKIKDKIQERHGYAVYMRPPVIVRWVPGNSQSPHADKQLNDGTPNPFPSYDINSIIYWNDDFEGGQFYYQDHDIYLEIEAGMAVAHPGDINYLHGIKEITSGVRWTSPAFTTITDLGEN